MHYNGVQHPAHRENKVQVGIFGADGIRGEANKPPLDENGVERIGYAIGRWFLGQGQNPTLLMGTDTRESCQRLKSALIYSINRSGVHTVDSGILPTAAVSYLLASKGYFAGGIMISASHNPIEENGIKIMDERGVKLDEEVEARIDGAYLHPETYFRPASLGKNISEPRFARQYARDLADEFKRNDWRSVQLLLDCANGAAYEIAPLVFDHLGIHYCLANAWPDGTNINKSSGSEYARMEPQRMAEYLRTEHLPYGLALDGDADRAVFVDDRGRFYDGDMLLAMLALKLQKENLLAGNRVVITPMSNSGLEEYLTTMRISVQTVQNGDKYVTRAILNDHLALGGEQIGHVVIHTQPSHTTGDGIRTALFILSELARNPRVQLHELAAGMNKWPQINVAVRLNERTELQIENIPGLLEKVTLIKAHFPDIRVRACRPASTEPSYRIMLEARQTPVNVLASCAREMAAIIQGHFGMLDDQVVVLDLTHGGLA
jgi:phosphoglucosamine mutase